MSREDIFNFGALYAQAPLYRAVSDYVNNAPARFHMPGHKGGNSPLDALFGSSLLFDVTELPETDSLFDACGAILAAEKLAAEAFGAKSSVFSAGGATLCIQAMLRLVSQKGGLKVICGRNLHRSAVNAMSLLGIEPVWIWSRPIAGSSLPGIIDVKDIELSLKQNTDAAAVYITSPDYYGVMSDIGSLATICKRYGVPLIVDNAHGAHLAFIEDGALHPMRLGADICCDSAHKTLPVLTGGAILHLGEGFNPSQAKDAMALFGSTSPSYLIMLSLDIARAWAKNFGKAEFYKLRERVDEIKALCIRLGFGLPAADIDPVRLTIDTAVGGLTGVKAAELLRKGGVSVELYDDRHIVLLPSPFNSESDFKRLENELCRLPTYKAIPLSVYSLEKPYVIMKMSQALQAKSEMVETGRSIGKTAAESKCPCPPGVPIVMPGELISKNSAKVLENYGVEYIKVLK